MTPPPPHDSRTQQMREHVPALLEATGLTKTYGGVHALSQVSFAIRPGEIVAIAGENGSGKSTTARIIAGIVAPDEGEVCIDGRPLALRSPREALANGIALVTQEVSSIPELSIAENVFLGELSRPTRLFRRRSFIRQARPILRRAGVNADPGAPFESLRAGDRERVEIARALASDPRLLILDEATSRLGERDVDSLFEVLRQLRDEGTSSIIITHRLREMRQLADRVIVLRDGRLVGELERGELSDERLAAAMVGRDLGELYPPRATAVGARPILEVEGVLVEGSSSPISFALRPGQVIGLSGLVGSGRTELLETIAGARPCLEGRVLVDGKPIRSGSVRDALDNGVVLVPEDRHRQGLVLGETIQNNIAMGRWRVLGRRSVRQDRRAAQAGVAELGVKTHSVDMEVDALSGGNQQKVVMARCLAGQPRVLLLDEPARGIDVAAKASVFALINNIVSLGVGVVMASSDMLETLGMSDEIIVLHEGEIVGQIGRAEATEERLALLAAGGAREATGAER